MPDEFDLDMERLNTEEARNQRNAAVEALREIYRIRGEDYRISEICNRVLNQGWIELC